MDILGYILTGFAAVALVIGIWAGLRLKGNKQKIQEMNIRPWHIQIKLFEGEG